MRPERDTEKAKKALEESSHRAKGKIVFTKMSLSTSNATERSRRIQSEISLDSLLLFLATWMSFGISIKSHPANS